MEFVQRLINEIMGLANHVYGQDPLPLCALRLLALALQQSTLPAAALELSLSSRTKYWPRPPTPGARLRRQSARTQHAVDIAGAIGYIYCL